MYCPFCGRVGVYRVASASGAIAHFAHEGGELACVAAALESILHQRVKTALLDALRQLRREGRSLRSKLTCRRCGEPFVRAVLRANDWTDEAVEQALPGSAFIGDVAALLEGAPVFILEVYASHRVDAAKVAAYAQGGTAGLEVDARAFIDEAGKLTWSASAPLPLPLESWNLERAPRSFHVCSECRNPVEGLTELCRFAEALERQDMPAARDFTARLAQGFSVSKSVAFTHGVKPLRDAISDPEALRDLVGEAEAENAARRADWDCSTRVFFEALQREAGPWDGSSLSAVLDNPYTAMLERIRERSSVKDEWMETARWLTSVLELKCLDDHLCAQAGVVLLKQLEWRNDTALAASHLVEKLAKRLVGFTRGEIDAWLEREVRRERVLRAEASGAVRMVALASVLELEQKAARMAHWRITQEVPQVKEAYEDRAEALTGEQRQALLLALNHPFAVITGGPGTGKTTVVRSILAATRALPDGGGQWFLAAPTHKAVQRLKQATSPFSTVQTARTLQAWLRQADELKRAPPFGLIVDEAGFISVEHFVELLEVVRHVPRLILVGDPHQLPSISFGAVLRDLLECPDVPSVRLRVPHRASDARGLRAAADRILAGKLPQEASGVRLIHTASGKELQTALGEHRRLAASGGLETQVIAPSRKLVAELNHALRDECNPQGARLDGVKGLRSGERVVCTESRRELGLFNGQTGTVVGVEAGGLVLTVEGERLTVPLDLVESCLQPAYTLTVHKSQGSEWQNVVVVLDVNSYWVDQSLLFTAATRARETLTLVGPRTAIMRAASRKRRRLTLLGPLLADAFKKGRTSTPSSRKRRTAPEVPF